ncbi:hypothetical protein GOP47_0023144 [Adiantum capillus-veneris]|uniref:Uncharacterized protein n=1 Tax=Adiantum capillus-veneris TaxID=13818 RepID=A0A9D4Z682_ADICA|nr:hypothetical protein GOP47_0023144 [Adiantum capillus-veneris]
MEGAGSSTITKPSGWKVPLGDFFLLQRGPHTSKVLAYNVDLDLWSAVQLPCGLHSPHLHKYRGRPQSLLEDDKTRRSFGVWELQVSSSETATWVEVARTQSMPGPTRWLLFHAEGGLFYTRWHGEQGPVAPLVYNVSRNSW